MTEEYRIAYEKNYRELWLKQLLIDRKFNPMAAEPKKRQPRDADDADLMQRKKLKLSAQSEIINNLMNKSMLYKDIAEILGITQQAVSDTKKRYGLPRTAEEVASTNGE